MADETIIKLGLDVSDVKRGEKEFAQSAARIEGAARTMGKAIGDLTDRGDSGRSWVDRFAPSERDAERLASFTSAARGMAQVTKEIGAAGRSMQGVDTAQTTRQIGEAFGAMAQNVEKASRSLGAVDLERLQTFIKTAKQAASLARDMQTVGNATGATPRTGQEVRDVRLVAARSEALRAAVAEEAAARKNLATGEALLTVVRKRVAAYEQLKAITSGSEANQELTIARQVAAQEQRIADQAERQAAAKERAAAAAIRGARQDNLNEARNAVSLTRDQLGDALRYANSLENMRYASQELRNELAILTAGVGALSTAFVRAASTQERALADIARTTQLSYEGSRSLQALSAAMADMSSNDMSVPFKDLAQIATLGAQMDIPTARLADFTEAVGGFAAITDVSVDTASEAFGRIVNTFQQARIEMNGAAEGREYTQLASQIAELGTASVATEGEILTMTNSIAASAVSAGIGQDEVLAYAASLTSIGIKAEWARGSMQRIFAGFNEDAAAGVTEMTEYARLLGITAQEADALWRTDPSKFFNDIVYSLNAISDPIERAQAISSLGIVNTRDVQLMQRLAVNAGLLSQAMQDSQSAGQDTGFFENSLKTLNDTFTETLARFRNSLSNMMANFGDPFLAPLKLVLNALNAVMQVLSDIGQTPVGRVFAAFSGGVGAVVALGTAMKTLQFGVLNVASSFIQMREKMAEIGISGPLTWGNIRSAIQQANSGVAQAIPLYQRLEAEMARLNELTRQNRVANTGPLVDAGRAAGATATAGLSTSASAAAAAESKLAAATASASREIGVQAGVSRAASASMGAQAATTTATAAATTTATGATWSLKGALTALGLSNPFGWALTAISFLPTVITMVDEMTTTAEEARAAAAASSQDTLDVLGGSTSLLDAVKEDTLNYANGVAGSYEDLRVAVGGAGQAASDSADAWYYWLDAQGNIVQATMETAEAQDLLALKTGDTTRALIAQSLMEMEEFQAITGDQLRAMAEAGFDWGTYANKVSAGENGAQAGEEYVNGFINEIRNKIIDIRFDDYGFERKALSAEEEATIARLQAQLEALEAVRDEVLNVGGAFDTAAQQQLVYAQLMGDAAAASDDATDAMGGTASALEAQQEAWEQLVSQMENYVGTAFSAIDGTAAVYDAMDALNQSVYDNGNTFAVTSEAGRENIAALEEYLNAVVQTAISAAERLGYTGAVAQEYVHGQVQQAIDELNASGFDLSGVEGAMTDLDSMTASTLTGPEVDTSGFTAANNLMVSTAANTVNQINSIYAGLPGTPSVAGGMRYAAPGRSRGNTLLSRRVNWLTSGGSGTRGTTAGRVLGTSNAFDRGRMAAANRMAAYSWTPKVTGGSGGGGGGSRAPRSSGGSAPRSSGGGSGSAPRSSSTRREKSPEEQFADFLKRLSSAMKDALDSFWQMSDAHDGYHSQLNKMRKSIEDSKKQFEDLGDEIADLTARLGEQQQKLDDAKYFNAIAKKYGDTERIKSTQVEIDSATQDISETQKSIDAKRKEREEIRAGMLELNGYTDAAIANRAALRSLQSQMIAMIDAYAAQGHSTAEIAAYTAQLKNEFISQATQMGFNREQVVQTAGAFDSLTTSINNTPRTVPMEVSDYGSAGRTGAAIGDAASNGGQGYFAPVEAKADTAKAEASFKILRAPIFKDIYLRMHTKAAGGHILQRHAMGGPVRRFASGGYLNAYSGGNSYTDNLRAFGPNGETIGLQGGEYVVRKSAVDYYGKGLLDAINASKFRPMEVSRSGPATGQVSIDPNQIAMLARAVSSVIMLDGQAISSNINRQYAMAGKRGSV